LPACPLCASCEGPRPQAMDGKGLCSVEADPGPARRLRRPARRFGPGQRHPTPADPGTLMRCVAARDVEALKVEARGAQSRRTGHTRARGVSPAALRPRRAVHAAELSAPCCRLLPAVWYPTHTRQAALESGEDPDQATAPMAAGDAACACAPSSATGGRGAAASGEGAGGLSAAAAAARPIPMPVAAATPGVTPLLAAVQAGWADGVRLLVRHGACLSARTPAGAAPPGVGASSCTCRPMSRRQLHA
jgi:hypothetical protein